jgi:ABC-type glycerol-3-phosphate transport system substrate-binding protein
MVSSAAGRSAGTLGGWGLGISSFSREPDLAFQFIRLATRLDMQRTLCLDTGYAPARRDAYDDPELLRANPFLRHLLSVHDAAVARPTIARYALVSDILQRKLSAALAGSEPPGKALASAARETRLTLGSRKHGAPGVGEGAVP